MKVLIILVLMAGAAGGAWHSWNTRNLFVQAALYSEAFSLAAHAKRAVADHFVRTGMMPHDNADAGLPPPQALYGTSVKRVAVNRGGVLMVDFDPEIGKQSMTFTPSASSISGMLDWHCTSDSIDRVVLEKLRPPCTYLPASLESQLMHAIANARVETAQRLLDAGADANAVVYGNTPMMLAAKRGEVEIVRRLMAAGAQIDHPSLGSERRTPLMVAISSDQAEVAAELLSRGASITERDYRGMSAMDHAAATDTRLGGNRYVLMVSAGLNPRFAGYEQTEHADVTTQVNREIDLQQLYGELRAAAGSCHTQRLSSLLLAEHDLKARETVAGKAMTAYIEKPACRQILTDFVMRKASYQQALQAYAMDVMQRCDAPLTEQLLRDNPGLQVLRPIAGRSLLHRALGAGCDQVVSLMLRKAHLAGKLPDDILLMALRSTPQSAMVRVVGSLLAADANVHVQDSSGQTALSVAIALEQPTVAKYLVDAGVDVNRAGANGTWPLIEATKKGYEHLVTQLISQGARLDQRDALGRTALLAAVAAGQERLVDTLLRAGANRYAKDSDGIDAVLLAQSKRYRQISTLLAEASDW